MLDMVHSPTQPRTAEEAHRRVDSEDDLIKSRMEALSQLSAEEKAAVRATIHREGSRPNGVHQIESELAMDRALQASLKGDMARAREHLQSMRFWARWDKGCTAYSLDRQFEHFLERGSESAPHVMLPEALIRIREQPARANLPSRLQGRLELRTPIRPRLKSTQLRNEAGRSCDSQCYLDGALRCEFVALFLIKTMTFASHLYVSLDLRSDQCLPSFVSSVRVELRRCRC